MCRCDLTRQTAENTARIANKESNMVDKFQNDEQRLCALAFEQANNCQHFEDEFLSVPVRGSQADQHESEFVRHRLFPKESNASTTG